MKRNGIALCVVAMSTALSSASAESAADFYRGKTLTFLVGSGVGGSYEFYARALAAHLPRHIPGNPAVIVKMTGGSGAGLPAAIQMQSTAARDGTIFCMTQQTIVVSQVIETVSAGKFDVRTWHWVGLMAPVRKCWRSGTRRRRRRSKRRASTRWSSAPARAPRRPISSPRS